MAKNRKVKSGIISAKDIMKGFTELSHKYDIWTLAPIQCLPQDEKTKDWIKWNADWNENIALRELPKKSQRLEKLYNLAAGVINKSDYIYNPQGNDVSNHLGIIGESDTEQTLLQQFFPIIPPIIKNFLGEYIKMDKKVIVDAVDPDSISEMLQYKEDELKQILMEQAMQKKQLELMKQGIIQTNDASEQSQKTNEFIQSEMKRTQQIAEIEMKFKKFRTIAAQWGQHFIDKYYAYNNFDEIELRMYLDSIIADEYMMALELYDDNFKPYYLEPKKTFVNMSPTKTNYSDASSIVNVEFLTIPEIINTFRKDLNDEQIALLESQYNGIYTNNILMGTDSNGPFGSGYYNPKQTYAENQKIGANIKEAISDMNIEAFIANTFGSKGSVFSYSGYFNNPKLVRVSRIWWASQRRVGELSRMVDGELNVDLVDDNYLITEKPIYDKSLFDEETARTLVSGEHIEWTYKPEWRYVVKIGQNTPYWIVNPNTNQNCIYLYGAPLEFQRKGSRNHYDAKPPVEGRRISERNTISVSVVEHLKPWQITYNVVNNKILKLMPDDIGPILVTNESALDRNSLNMEDGREPLFEFLDNLRANKVLINKDLQTGLALNGSSLKAPTVVDISTVDKMATYLKIGQEIKFNAYESIGVSRERLSSVQASQSAAGTQQSVAASINQTEVYFDIFANKGMPRIWQMILDYGQYYTTKSDEFSDTYINTNMERQFFKILKNQLLMKDLQVYAFSKANVRKLMSDLKTLMMQDNTMGATFLDKIKGLQAGNPAEIIEKLEEAEAQRQDQVKQQQDHEAQMQQQQQQFMEQQAQEAAAAEDKRFYAKLENDKYIAELKANSNVQMPEPDLGPDPLDVAKQQSTVEDQVQNRMMKDRQLRMQDQQGKDATEIQREKLQLDRDKMASNERIAIENKNSSDIQFDRTLKQKQQLANRKK